MTTIDYGILIGVLLIMVIIGKMASDRIYTNQDFLLAGRSVKSLPLGISLAATDFGGAGLLGTLYLVYTYGLSGGLWLFTAIPAWFIVGYIFPKYYRSNNITTVPEFLEKTYGVKTRLLATILHLIGIVYAISAQTLVAAIVIHALTGVSLIISAFIAVVVFVIYSAFGGLIAVIWTDVFSFVIIFFGLVFALISLMNQVGSSAVMTLSMPENYTNLLGLGISEPFSWMIMGILWYATSQYYVQRMLAAKSTQHAKNAYYFTGGATLIYGILVTLTGILLYNSSPNLQGDEFSVINAFIASMPMGVKGLLLTTVLVVTMSTSSSYINSAASLMTIDIYKRMINKRASDNECIRIARYTTIGIGLITLITFTWTSGVIDRIVWSNLIFSSSVFCPMLFAFKRFVVNKDSAFIAMIVTSCVAFGSTGLLLVGKYPSVLPHPILLCTVISIIIMTTLNIKVFWGHNE